MLRQGRMFAVPLCWDKPDRHTTRMSLILSGKISYYMLSSPNSYNLFLMQKRLKFCCYIDYRVVGLNFNSYATLKERLTVGRFSAKVL